MYYGLCVSVLMRDNTLSLLLCISCAFTRWRHLDDSLSVSCQQTSITSLLTLVRVARSTAAATAGIYWYICTLTDWLTVVYSWTPCNLLYNCCQTATSWRSLPLHHNSPFITIVCPPSCRTINTYQLSSCTYFCQLNSTWWQRLQGGPCIFDHTSISQTH